MGAIKALSPYYQETQEINLMGKKTEKKMLLPEKKKAFYPFKKD